MTAVRELLRPQPMALNSTFICGGSNIGGFVAKTAGTISVTDADGTLLVDAIPVAAGQYLPLPFVFRTSMGGLVTLAGGASGTLGC